MFVYIAIRTVKLLSIDEHVVCKVKEQRFLGMKSVVEKYTIECKICFIDVDLYGLIRLYRVKFSKYA